jgi:hypothetical protein
MKQASQVKRAAALTSLVVVLANCAGQGAMTGQDQTAAYKDGFDDGCQSGRASAFSLGDRYKKNVNRFESNKQYAQGWYAGFDQCAFEQTQRSAAGAN